MKKSTQSQLRIILSTLARTLLFVLVLTLSYFIFTISKAYYSPDFTKGFLIDKATAFRGGLFPFGLYAHILSFPFIIVFTSLLICFRLEVNFPRLHKTLGKISAILVLFVFVPSGIILSFWALGGLMGTLNFILLSLLTFLVTFCAIKQIKSKNIQSHRTNMMRMYLLLTSAITLRVLLFIFGYYFGFRGELAYVIAAITSWTLPLIIFEVILFLQKKTVNKSRS